MSLIFSSVDPSGVYRDFVKGALRSQPQKSILWVWGDGNNGKTTLGRAVQKAYPHQTINLSPDFEGPVPEEIRLAFVRDPPLGWIPGPSEVPMIIESNHAPPTELDCVSLRVSGHFNDRTHKVDLEAVRAIIAQ